MVICYFLLPRDKCQCSCSVLPPLLQCHQEMRCTENCGEKSLLWARCFGPPGLQSTVWVRGIQIPPLCEQHKVAEAALASPAQFLSVYKKEQRMSQKQGERIWEKGSHVSDQEESGNGSQLCRLEQFVQLSLHTSPAAHTEMVSCCTQLRARKAPWKHQGEQ